MKLHLTVGNAMDELKKALTGVREHIVSEGEWDTTNWSAQAIILNTIISTNQGQFDSNAEIVTETTASLEENRSTLKTLSDSLSQAEDDYENTKKKIVE